MAGNSSPVTRENSGQLIGLWVGWMRAAGAPETTIGLRRYYMVRFAAGHPRLLSVSVDAMASWIGEQHWAPNTAKTARSSLRSFYRWAQVTGRIKVSPAHLLPPVRVPRGRPRPAPESSYRSAVDKAADPRARLAILLGAQCGMRRGEVARARREHIEPDLVGWSLRITGKGGHVRLVPVPDPLAGELLAMPPGWLFPSPAGAHLTPHHLAKLVTRCLPPGVTMHQLRHRCATVAYAQTRDLRAVQELLGHSRPETTAGYVQVPGDAIRAAVAAAAA